MTGTPTIGIDLGTTNSAIAHAKDDDINILPAATGDRTIPSVVAFEEKSGEALVGRQAVNQAVAHPDRTVFAVKRFMGTEETILLGSRECEFTPEEISGLILRKLKRDAQAYLERSIENAVITVPAYFNDRQRQATKHAGALAGLEVDRIINEPTAACLAYGLQTAQDKTVLVYDLGGGTFDSSLIEITNGVFEVVGTSGDTRLGGNDWDALIVEWLEDRIERDHGISVADTPLAEERLFDAAQTAKHELSNRHATTITIPFLEHDDGTSDIEQTLHRDTFEEMTQELLDTTIERCETLFDQAGYDRSEIDEILLVGGATRMPQVRRRIKDRFGVEPSKRINPDEAVAIGAAAQAAILDGELLPGQWSQTHRRTQPTELSPTSASDNVVLLDVTPQSFGVELIDRETYEPYYHVVIERNSPIPARNSYMTTTSRDNQTEIEIPVYQGHNDQLEENEFLDSFELGPIPQRPEGVPNIEVKFMLDENGILNVSARDVDHEIGDAIEIQSVFGFTDDELSVMQQNLPEIK
ncbi:Hsp70 family protein [Halocatena salina]|uniref:Hsp70 family protein n=1 Tax=Halocatena salina TaxID=2934340 RepID=A0A8U0A2T9_9EURY|nr:Hsp70 family protein [Halocatena salina]UPM43402.1 Hsp70 family protein [Halocatena salina]